MLKTKTFRFNEEMLYLLEKVIEGQKKEVQDLGLSTLIDVNQTNAIYMALQVTHDELIRKGYLPDNTLLNDKEGENKSKLQ